MITLAPNIIVPKFELSIYESISSNTDTNDTVIYRDIADTELEKAKIISKAKRKYSGYKYKIYDFETDNSEIGILM